jgi:membrane-bound lytic murein transglycosylase B
MILLRKKHVRYIFAFIFLLIIPFFSTPLATAQAKGGNAQFDPLKKMLIADGFDEKMINDIYTNRNVYFETKGVSLFVVHREAKLNYDQFTSKKSINRARRYMKKYKPELEKAEKDYGVDKEVVTAIILVETQLGTRLGRPLVLNTLSTMSALADPVIRDAFWLRIKSSARLNRKEFEKWVNRKSKWAYAELKAFLKYTIREEIDPTDIFGSYAGAIGISQFMPSNISSFAKDGDNDGRIDLFNHADAIMSVAYYLKHYGWHPKIGTKRARKVIFHYNHSEYYVKAVLKIVNLLKV